MTKFDVFVVGEIMLKDGAITDRLFRDAFTYGMSGKWGYGDFLGKYCREVAGCSAPAITTFLSRMAFKVKFHQRRASVGTCLRTVQCGQIDN